MLNQRQHLVLGRPPGRVYEPPSPALCSVRQAPGWRPLSRAHYGDATRVAHLRVARLRAFRRPWLQHAGHRCSRSLPRPAECSANAGCHPQARRRAAHLGRGPVLGRERKLCLKVAIGEAESFCQKCGARWHFSMTDITFTYHRALTIAENALRELQRVVVELKAAADTAPVVKCPACGSWVPDLDGFGVLAHPKPDGCGYCSHPSRTGSMCNICGDVEGAVVNVRLVLGPDVLQPGAGDPQPGPDDSDH